MMQYEIIDFHTHPFVDEPTNICAHKEYCNMSAESTYSYLKEIGIEKICGSVISLPALTETEVTWDMIAALNQTALSLREKYGDFYIPGFHVHPKFVEESCREIERMSKLGIRLIGELVPYLHGWSDYSCEAFNAILDVATAYNMVVSFHSMDEDQMDAMVKKHPDTVFVAAHPGEAPAFKRHLQRMKMSEHYHLDLSGTGLFRHGLLRHGIDECGADCFIFGSDYPTCSPAMFIGGVYFDALLTEEEKRMIFSENAKRLLRL